MTKPNDDVWTCPKCGGRETQSDDFELVWHPELGAYLGEPITIWCMNCQKEFDVTKVKVQFT
jgi:ubiquitin C-terminal hydrolase